MNDSPSQSRGRPIVPVFPLPGVFLFPGCVMPLHVFEPRYRQMIEDLLDADGRLVMGALVDGTTTADGSPRFGDVCGLGEIGRHEKLPDGRFLVWLVGIGRVEVEEVASDRLYRRVAIRPLVEEQVPRDDEPAVRAALQQALLARCNEPLELPAGVPLTHVVDLLLQRLGLPCTRMQELFAEPNVRRRAQGALLEHSRRALPPPPPAQN